MKILSGISVSLLILITSCDRGDQAEIFEKWDTDPSEGITKEEFFERWHGAGYWHLWDRDGDGSIAEWEWNKGLDDYYDKFDRDQIGFNDFDLDNDGLLDSEEMVEGEFVLWDTNKDGNIDKIEFTEMSYPVPTAEQNREES